jgi:hypothetical protein
MTVSQQGLSEYGSRNIDSRCYEIMAGLVLSLRTPCQLFLFNLFAWIIRTARQSYDTRSHSTNVAWLGWQPQASGCQHIWQRQQDCWTAASLNPYRLSLKGPRPPRIVSSSFTARALRTRQLLQERTNCPSAEKHLTRHMHVQPLQNTSRLRKTESQVVWYSSGKAGSAKPRSVVPLQPHSLAYICKVEDAKKPNPGHVLAQKQATCGTILTQNMKIGD